ncbi:tetratricopeptide repeat protein [Dyadobacter sp. 676]|uniref:histidine kinase n=1 Tax=Dyadobacter sp. 676 TaxID=3088362 RepID=A0AAU8FKM8_9BACT
MDWQSGLLIAYRGIGLHYQRKGAFLEAAYYFQKGLLIAEKTNDRNYRIETYKSLGAAYSAAGDFKRSMDALKAAEKIAIRFGKEAYISVANEIGNTHFSAKEFLLAKGRYLQCIRLNVPIDSARQCWFLINLAGTYQALHLYDLAIGTYSELFRYDKYLTREDRIVSMANFGRLYNSLGNPNKALRLAQTAERYVQGKEGHYTLQLLYRTLAEALKAKGEWRKAYEAQARSYQYRDSMLSQDQRQRLEAVKVGYESEKRRADLEIVREEMNLQREQNTLLWAGTIVCALMGSVVLFFYIQVRKKRAQIERQKNEISVLNGFLEERIEQRTAELQRANLELAYKNKDIQEALLTGQTLERQRVAAELHDNLGGTLTAIQWYLDAMAIRSEPGRGGNNYVELNGMVSRAYSEVRLLAHHMMPEVLQKEGLENALQQLSVPINQSDRLKLSLKIDEVSQNLSTKQRFELYSIALELCTNVLKHSHATHALLELYRFENEVILRVSDNGIGITSENRAKRNGFQEHHGAGRIDCGEIHGSLGSERRKQFPGYGTYAGSVTGIGGKFRS